MQPRTYSPNGAKAKKLGGATVSSDSLESLYVDSSPYFFLDFRTKPRFSNV